MKIPLGFLMAALLFPALLSAEPADEPIDAKVLRLQKAYEQSAEDYKKALTEKRKMIERDIEKGEELLAREQDADLRKTLLQAIEDLRAARSAVNDKIRVINASDVVRYANGRNKILSTLTGQTPA